MEGGETVGYNIDMTAALKPSKPDNYSKAVDFPVNSAERPNSFRDSLKEAVKSYSRDERRTEEDNTLRNELVNRSSAKLKSLKKPEVKNNRAGEPEFEGDEKKTDKIVKTMEELLSKLEELIKLQQLGEVPQEKQAVLHEGIKDAIKVLTTEQSKGTVTETAKLEEVTPELKAALKGMLEELKTSGNMVSKEAISDFTQELKSVIAETASIQTASKTSVVNNAAEMVQKKEDSNNVTVNNETDKAQVIQNKDMNTNPGVEGKVTNEADENQKQGMKLEVVAADMKPVVKEAKPLAEEATEEVKSAIDSKVDKVTVEEKDNKRQDGDAKDNKGAEHEIPKPVIVTNNKQGNQEMTAIKLEQTVIDNQVEVVQNQTTAPKPEAINKTEVINQIVKKAELIFTDAKQEMRMQLEPENLGKLTLKLAVERGLVTAKFVAESYEVKQVIESNFNELKDMLQEKGLEVQGFSVSVRQDNKENNSDNAFHQWKETVKLNGRSMNRGSYDGYQTGENTHVRAVNPYSIHNGKFDHKA